MPQAKLHNVILYNSSKIKVCFALGKPAGCISTLCKIAAHGASQLMRISLRSVKAQSHRRKEATPF